MDPIWKNTLPETIDLILQFHGEFKKRNGIYMHQIDMKPYQILLTIPYKIIVTSYYKSGIQKMAAIIYFSIGSPYYCICIEAKQQWMMNDSEADVLHRLVKSHADENRRTFIHHLIE